MKINENFLKLQDNYLFSTIVNKVNEFENKHPNIDILKLGIGDVTRPLPRIVIETIQNVARQMGDKETFVGYGPEVGYSFLKKKIMEKDYKKLGIHLQEEEIFISDGIGTDIGNIVDIFSKDNKVAITDPVYPAYVDTNVMSGRSGEYIAEKQQYEGIIYLPLTEENQFLPDFPKEKVDLIYLCNPNNPTGTAMNREVLQKWVNYAIDQDAIILYDAAYEAFIEENEIPHSIYELDGAKKIAIEFKSFSKTAGFTGIRCGYTIIPKEIRKRCEDGTEVNLNQLWNRRQCTKFNGVSYITQKAAEALYTEEGEKECIENILYYKQNMEIMRKGLTKKGFKIFGGKNAPYIWIKIPNKKKSWDFFDELLEKTGVVGTPRNRIWS